MIATIEYVHILDKADQLAKMILHSDVMQTYEKAKITLKEDDEAQHLIQAFNHIKEQYEDVERFGRYHPNYADIIKNVRSVKRKMDLHESVANFKIAERELQRFLDEISEYIAQSVSEHIIVPKDDGLFTDKVCTTGGCSSGGSCSCQVS